MITFDPWIAGVIFSGLSTGPNAVHEDADYLAALAALQAKP